MPGSGLNSHLQAASTTSAAAAATSANAATPCSASVAGPAVAKDEEAVAAPEVKQAAAGCCEVRMASAVLGPFSIISRMYR